MPWQAFVGPVSGLISQPILRNFPLPFDAYQTALKPLDRQVVGCLLEPEEEGLRTQIERILFKIHRTYYRNGLTTDVHGVIGYPGSIDFTRTFPTRYLVQDVRKQIENYVDKRSFVSQAQTEARERMLDCLDNKFSNLLQRTEVSGATCYVLLIALGACCGGRFEPDIYKLCVETLTSIIAKMSIDSVWNSEKTQILINTASCLLPSKAQTGEFVAVVSMFFKYSTSMDSLSAATTIHNEIINQLGGCEA